MDTKEVRDRWLSVIKTRIHTVLTSLCKHSTIILESGCEVNLILNLVTAHGGCLITFRNNDDDDTSGYIVRLDESAKLQVHDCIHYIDDLWAHVNKLIAYNPAFHIARLCVSSFAPEYESCYPKFFHYWD